MAQMSRPPESRGPMSLGPMSLRLDPSELYNLKVLEGVSLASIEDQLRRCQLRTIEAGEVLLTLGQPNTVMYMVLSGKLAVYLELGTQGDPVAFIQAGETVGELSVLDSRPASANVIAAERTRLLAVDELTFWSLVNASHDFAINLLFSLAGRLRANNSAVTTSMRLQREYKKNAMVDALTGIYNRRWLEDALPRFVKRYARDGQPLSLLILDVDHFKTFNDRFGHAAGDTVLVMVAKTLRENVRPMDHVARYGGEEFVVLLPGTTDGGGRQAAERLREAVGATPVSGPDGQPLPPVTISIGGATLVAGQSGAELLSTADGHLYASKKNGRNRVTF